MHLFNYGFSTFNILSAVGGVVYYSMSGKQNPSLCYHETTLTRS